MPGRPNRAAISWLNWLDTFKDGYVKRNLTKTCHLVCRIKHLGYEMLVFGLKNLVNICCIRPLNGLLHCTADAEADGDNEAHFHQKITRGITQACGSFSHKYVNGPVSCCMYVLSPTVQALRCFLQFPLPLTAPLLCGLPPCWVVLCSISCFSLKSNCLLFASTLPLNFPPFPILSTHSSLLLYSLLLPLILHIPPTLLFRCSYHLIDCLLMPPFLPPLLSLNPSHLPSSLTLLILFSCSCPARCRRVCPCITMTTPPRPLLNYSWESSPVSVGPVNVEKTMEDSVKKQRAKKQIVCPLTAESNQIMLQCNVACRRTA